jgi:hypothetical protein
MNCDITTCTRKTRKKKKRYGKKLKKVRVIKRYERKSTEEKSTGKKVGITKIRGKKYGEDTENNVWEKVREKVRKKGIVREKSTGESHVTSGDVTSGHVTSGCSSSLLRK